ncbi:helix-turn-helix transcriptional regulator [Coraliomargarita sp. W4R72]
MSFGQRLKILRVQTGWSSIEAFAKAVGVSRATVYNWEKSDEPPNGKYLIQIAEALKMDIEEILRQRNWERGKNLDEAPSIYNQSRVMYRPTPGPPDTTNDQPTAAELKAWCAHYIDEAAAHGAESLAAYHIYKFLDPKQFGFTTPPPQPSKIED